LAGGAMSHAPQIDAGGGDVMRGGSSSSSGGLREYCPLIAT